jgi:hypothetical protein
MKALPLALCDLGLWLFLWLLLERFLSLARFGLLATLRPDLS